MCFWISIFPLNSFVFLNVFQWYTSQIWMRSINSNRNTLTAFEDTVIHNILLDYIWLILINIVLSKNSISNLKAWQLKFLSSLSWLKTRKIMLLDFIEENISFWANVKHPMISRNVFMKAKWINLPKIKWSNTQSNHPGRMIFCLSKCLLTFSLVKELLLTSWLKFS